MLPISSGVARHTYSGVEPHPDAIADLTPELQAILDDWDPLGIVDDYPDEYHGLNGSVLACLSRAEDLQSFTGSFMAIADEFCKEQPTVANTGGTTGGGTTGGDGGDKPPTTTPKPEPKCGEGSLDEAESSSDC